MGTLAFTTTGLAIYGPTEAAIPADKPYGDPNYNGLLDTCGGHTGPSAEYHNHVLYTLAACNLNSRAVLGYAIDGFPIYGPTACLNVACTSTGTVRSGTRKSVTQQKMFGVHIRIRQVLMRLCSTHATVALNQTEVTAITQ
jgi:hypothetical protein